ncbi:MAG TPA: TIGR03936 family radical SAM-associated protein [Acidimicrobiales bacterium]|nr:TIGR03936 family radical SAM-associated protein [Acidimicrobiales bacterium]
MRVRVRFTKLGKVRWTSHRDVARMWERALRRVSLPLAYTSGFTPRPKISFGLALPTGHESLAEYLDVELATAQLDATILPALLTPALPVGIDVLAAAAVDERDASLQENVTSCSWDVEALGASEHELFGLAARALAADSLVITRERKGTEVVDDVRPGVVSIAVTGPSPCVAEGFEAHAGGVVLACELATQPRGLRPNELLRALGPGLEQGHVRRLHQWIERDGARWEPLPVGATDAPHAKERAS